MEAGEESSGATSPESASAMRASGSEPAQQMLPAASGNWAKARQAIGAAVRDHHGARAAQEGDAGLAAWLVQASGEVQAADGKLESARAAYQQADSQRATARDAYRADPKNAAKSAAWHAAVQCAQQAQDALRAAREASARAHSLCKLLQREAAGRGLQVDLPPGVGTATAGTKRKRRGAPAEPCPYCQHTYTVRDGLSNKTDAQGTRLHLRRCQCREKTPPCRNCPHCKALPALMAVADAAEQQRLCRDEYRCEICACKCPGAGKWIESDVESRQAFAQRTEQRHGALSALGWGGAAGAGDGSFVTSGAAPSVSGKPSRVAGQAGSNGAGPSGGTATAHPAGPGPATAAAAAAAAVTPPPPPAAAAGEEEEEEEEEQEGGLEGGASLLQPLRPTRAAAGRPSSRALKRLPADIRSDLEQAKQAQQEQSTVHILAGMASEKRAASSGVQRAAPAEAAAWPAAAGAEGEQRAQQAQREEPGHSVHFHTCSHPHNECTSECCSAPHAPQHGRAGCDADLETHADSHGRAGQRHHHQHHHHHHHTDRGSAQVGPDPAAAALPTLAALAVAAQQHAQHGAAPSPLMALSNRLGSVLGQAQLPGELVASLHLFQQMLGAAGAAGAAGSVAGGSPSAAQPLPPPELPPDVTALVGEVFLHASGQHGVEAVSAFLRAQRVTALSDLEYMELSWLVDALQPRGLTPLLLNKFLQLGRKQAAAGTAGAGEGAAGAAAAEGPAAPAAQGASGAGPERPAALPQQQQQPQEQELRPGA